MIPMIFITLKKNLEKICFDFLKILYNFFCQGNCFCSYICISTLLFNFTHMKIIYIYCPPQNMNSIGEVCDSLGKDSVTWFDGNHWLQADSGCMTSYDLE